MILTGFNFSNNRTLDPEIAMREQYIINRFVYMMQFYFLPNAFADSF